MWFCKVHGLSNKDCCKKSASLNVTSEFLKEVDENIQKIKESNSIIFNKDELDVLRFHLNNGLLFMNKSKKTRNYYFGKIETLDKIQFDIDKTEELLKKLESF